MEERFAFSASKSKRGGWHLPVSLTGIRRGDARSVKGGTHRKIGVLPAIYLAMPGGVMLPPCCSSYKPTFTPALLPMQANFLPAANAPKSPPQSNPIGRKARLREYLAFFPGMSQCPRELR